MASIDSTDSTTVRRTFLDYFAQAGPRDRRRAVARAAERPDAAVHQRRHGPVQGRLHRQPSRALHARDHARRSACAPAASTTTSRTSAARARHHTFFEMLGNFSFGDYFKDDAIAFAWELLTKDYGARPEAAGRHRVRRRRRLAGRRRGARALEEGHRLRATTASSASATKDNFWEMGDTGPCGPCREIHYYQGDDIPCAEAADGRRGAAPATAIGWLEIWNLVFMQFERRERTAAAPLPEAVGRHRRGPRARDARRAGRALELRHRSVRGRSSRTAAELVGQDVRPTDCDERRRLDARDRRPRARARRS